MTQEMPLNPSALGEDVVHFDAITPEAVGPLVDAAISAHRTAIERICAANDPGFDTILVEKEKADLALSHAWSPVSHLHRVANTPALRDAHATAEAQLSDHGLWVSQNRALYDATVAARWIASEEEWSLAQRRLRSLALRNFELSGVALVGAERERFREIVAELTQLSTAFGNAVLDATDGYALDIKRRKTLDGIPESYISAFRAAAQTAGVAGWRVGLQGPDVHAVLLYAKSRWLRRTIYKAHATRASDQGPHRAFDNSGRIEQIMALRFEAARLLGFATIADHSLSTKMAQTSEEVEHFLLDLAVSARSAGSDDLAEVREYAATKLGLVNLMPWDVGFVSDLIRCERYAFDAETVRAYFPAHIVTAGVMALITDLFGVSFVPRSDVPVWHGDVSYFDVFDQTGEIIAGVYLDLFARSGKQGGAWMDVCRQRFRSGENKVHPVAYLTCNFAGPVSGGVATLRHDDVVTFLHEFGHVLHHILTEVDYPSIGGISGVEWDAVELPSQLMENFAWDYEALCKLSAHSETGEPLARDLFDRMLIAKNFQSGLRLCRQIEFALFDLRLHRDYDPALGARVLEILDGVRNEVSVMRPPRWHRFSHAFTHIFAGGYSAGYYSYLWAELLSADAFGRFRDAGGISAEIGASLRAEILSRGATRTTAENFSAFRGRAPDPHKLLESHGLNAPPVIVQP